MTETTRLPVKAGRYRYTPAGYEWWTHVQHGSIIVRLVFDEDGNEVFLYRGYALQRNALPGMFRGPLEEAGKPQKTIRKSGY